MKKLILLFSHTLTPTQKEDAKNSFGVEEFLSLPKELQTLWSHVPSEIESLDDYLEPLKSYLKSEFKKGDVVLVQGDFGATFSMVTFIHSLGFKAVYATTKRNVVEEKIEGKVIKTSVFEHVRFREYL